MKCSEVSNTNIQAQIAKEAAAGIACIHEKNLIHGDVAARNILLTHDKHVKAMIPVFGWLRISLRGWMDGWTDSLFN